ncbi:SusD/RagB family nutrient-binding outer membrane lipoprotein [Limibacter armeniacum]|uniref:SusD/RagB family nutrient-binding outer membrane lipoprotein n=1 Tax=Limibacter armeniacum TaxID=466084 RepID=UPI002FE581B8
MMFNIKNILVTMGVALGALSFTACTSDFDEINTDPNRIDQISPGTLLNPIIYEMASFGTARSEAFTFDIMQVALPFPSAAGGYHRYDLTPASGNSTWKTYYRWLNNVREMRDAAITAEDPNYQAIAMTLNAWGFSILTDCFGDIPMTEAVRGSEGIFYPAFDTQQDIYTALLTDLDSANSLYDVSRSMVFGNEILYGNDVDSWKRFTNSLRLRLLLRVSNRSEMNVYPELVKMLEDPETYPIFTSNEDAAILSITGETPNVSPWGRPQDLTTGRATSEFFIENLNNFNDPRLPIFCSEARAADGQTKIGYKGIPSGYDASENFDFTPSNMLQALVIAPMISVVMSYAEVEFIKAELIQQGIMSGDAQAHYQAGVQAAIEQWGGELPDGYFENEYTAYDGTLEQIMLQKYYALFFNDFQQWFEYRRTGYPVLPKTDAMLNNQQVPVRYMYPDIVQISNGDNYNKVVQEMGGDDINIKCWWEK